MEESDGVVDKPLTNQWTAGGLPPLRRPTSPLLHAIHPFTHAALLPPLAHSLPCLFSAALSTIPPLPSFLSAPPPAIQGEESDTPPPAAAGAGLTVSLPPPPGSPPGTGCTLARVAIPPNAVAFQAGEAAQLLSAGALRAVAHAVAAPAPAAAPALTAAAPAAAAAAVVSRTTYALFLQPEAGHPLPPAPPAAALVTDARVPPLGDRFVGGDTFGDFAAKTIAAYAV